MPKDNHFVVALQNLASPDSALFVPRGSMLLIDWYGATVVVPESEFSTAVEKFWVVGGDGGDPILIPDTAEGNLILFPESHGPGAFTKRQLAGTYIAMDWKNQGTDGKVLLRRVGSVSAESDDEELADVSSLVPPDQGYETFLFRTLFKKWRRKWEVLNTCLLYTSDAADE